MLLPIDGLSMIRAWTERFNPSVGKSCFGVWRCIFAWKTRRCSCYENWRCNITTYCNCREGTCSLLLCDSAGTLRLLLILCLLHAIPIQLLILLLLLLLMRLMLLLLLLQVLRLGLLLLHLCFFLLGWTTVCIWKNWQVNFYSQFTLLPILSRQYVL